MGGFVNFTTRIAPESIVAGSVVDYSLATAYTTGQIVNYNGALWTATANSTGQAPAAGSAYWEMTNTSQTPIGIITGEADFSNNDLGIDISLSPLVLDFEPTNQPINFDFNN